MMEPHMQQATAKLFKQDETMWRDFSTESLVVIYDR